MGFLCPFEWEVGPFTVDRFANDTNKKVPRFYSKFFDKHSEGVDAFSYTWENENNLLVPPLSCISKVLHKCQTELVLGTLVVPYWVSAEYWPLLKPGGQWQHFIADMEVFPNASHWLKLGLCTFSPLGSEKFTGDMIAFRIIS